MSHEISITGQITPDQVPMIAENGFKTIINNRPDGEEPNQPTNADIAAAAKEKELAQQFRLLSQLFLLSNAEPRKR